MKSTLLTKVKNIGSTFIIASMLLLGVQTSWAQTTFNYTGSIQTYTVPVGVSSINIDVSGAEGGGSGGGLGAQMTGDFAVIPGEVLTIVVGQQGQLQIGGNSQNSSGGGGGVFVYNASNTLLIAAGGGGGKCNWTSAVPLHADAHGKITTNGGNDSSGGYIGGTAGNGGGAGLWSGTPCAGGGTGWITAGGGIYGGLGIVGGWVAGSPFCGGGGGGCGGFGGFGGGGGGGNHYGGGGGGGGYSGGAGGTDPTHGGGGGSFSSGTNQINTPGTHLGNGIAIITELCDGLVTTGPGTDVCFGDPVILTASSTNLGTVTWDNGVIDGVPFNPAVGTITYTATSTDANDCAYSIDITVNALPTVSGSVDNTNICDGAQATLTGAGALTYTWDNSVIDGVIFTPAVGTITYTVTGTDALGCQNTSTVDVTVFALPTITGIVDITDCDQVTLTGAGGISYLWDNSVVDGVVFTQAPGTVIYSVTGTDANGCINSTTVNVTTGINPAITLTATDEMAGNDGSIILVIDLGAAPYTFDWDNDGVGDNDDPQSLINIPAGTYTVIMTDANGCTTTQTITVGSQVGLDHLDALALSVYPNPTQNMLSIDLDGAYTYQLISLAGKTILTGEGVDKSEISLGELANGTYFIAVSTAQASRVIKVIKH
ncbi:MAG: hypothetical protein ACI837_000572 [Crocinitomicaceae bacterium]|jgi:hypothetical protein